MILKLAIIYCLIEVSWQEIPTVGYCLKVVQFKQDAHFLSINKQTNQLVASSNLDETTAKSSMWSNKYQYPRLDVIESEICNQEADACMSLNNAKSELELKADRGENDRWLVDFESSKSLIKHVNSSNCIELAKGELIATKCDSSNSNQMWSLVFIEESCVL